MSYDTQRPYAASYIVFRNENGEIAFVLRSNTNWMNGYCGLPAGKVENKESFIACAVREAKEEVGVSIKVDDLKHVLTMHRATEMNEKDMDWVDMFFEAESWEGELINAEPHMHSELAWLDPKNLPENMIPNVRYTIEQIELGNPYCEFNWEK